MSKKHPKKKSAVKIDPLPSKGIGFVLCQVSANSKGVYGTLVVDIRRKDGTGGSLRAARASVSFDANLPQNAICIPIKDDESILAYLEGTSATPPSWALREVYI